MLHMQRTRLLGTTWHDSTQLAMLACSVGLRPCASQDTEDIVGLLLHCRPASIGNTVSLGAYIHDNLRAVL